MQDAWNHPQFFACVDRWMQTLDDPGDLDAIRTATGMTLDTDFRQGQSWRILSGGGYYEPHHTFVDEMRAACRNRPRLRASVSAAPALFSLSVENATPNATHWIQASGDLSATSWTNLGSHAPDTDRFVLPGPRPAKNSLSSYRVEVAR